MAANYYIGLDLGQSMDWTALCVIQPHQAPAAKQWIPPSRYYGKKPQPPPECIPPPVAFWLRHLERLPRGTPYPRQVSHVLKLLDTQPLLNANELIVDATGVGRPVVDLFRQARVRNLVPVTITGGEKISHDENGWRVPKRDLVIATQVLLQQGRLKFAAELQLRDIFVKELSNFKVKIDPVTANDSYAAGREGDHDDLVLCVALAIWRAAMQTGAGESLYGIPRGHERRFAKIKGDSDWDGVK